MVSITKYNIWTFSAFPLCTRERGVAGYFKCRPHHLDSANDIEEGLRPKYIYRRHLWSLNLSMGRSTNWKLNYGFSWLFRECGLLNGSFFFFFERVCQMEVGLTSTCEIFLRVHFGTRSWNHPTKVHQLKSLLLFSPPWIIIDLESNIETITVQGMLTVFWVWFCLLVLYGLWSSLRTFIISFLFHVISLLELWKMMFNLRPILETNTNFQLLMESLT